MDAINDVHESSTILHEFWCHTTECDSWDVTSNEGFPRQDPLMASHITLGSYYFISTAGFMSRLPALTQLKAVVPLLQAQHMLVIDCLPRLILCCSVGGVKFLLTLGSIKEKS